jgi:hypothetical protein
VRNKDRFYEAFGHAEHVVMGRRLEVFSLRHRFWLEAFGSPLVWGGVVTLVDIEMAAAVCAVECGSLDREVPRMLSKGPRWRDMGRFTWRVLRRRTEAEYLAFQAYMADHGCPPATHGVAPKTKQGKSYEALPGLLGLVTALVRGSGWEPETVWSLSPGQAEWYLTGIFMHRGVDMRVKSSHDEEFEEELRKEREKCQVPSDQCQVPSAKCQVPSAKCQVPSAKCEVISDK